VIAGSAALQGVTAVQQGNIERQPDGIYRFTLRAPLEDIADE